MAITVALLGVLVGIGLVLIFSGIQSIERRRIVIRLPKLSWRSPPILAAGLALVGLLVALLTGWVLAILVFPLVGLGLPYLIGRTDGASDITKLEAMEEWTRSLAGLLTAGAGLEQAIVATLGSAPAALGVEVSRLVARIRARWTTPAAIRAFAEDLNDPTGDLIATNLLLGAQRRGEGLATILVGLAESVALDIRSRRQVEADASKPRSTARWVTIITTVVLCGLFLSGAYVAPYKSGVGQLILLVLLGTYAATLVWMKRTAGGPKVKRFLGEQASQAKP